MGAYRAVIGCNFNQFKGGSTEPNRYLVLDIQREKQITVGATIATQPLQDGDTMSDHMYRDPVTMSISGSFSINGKNWDDDSYDFMDKGDRLTNIQSVFEHILNEALLCTVTTIDEDDVGRASAGNGISVRSNAKNRFKTRKNMALKNIQWTEKQNNVEFTFQFQEVIMVEAQEYEELSEEERQELGLPRVMSPIGSSLGTVLADTGKLAEVIIRSLQDNGYITNDFWRWMATAGMAVGSIALGATILAVGVAIAAITASGAILAAIGAAGGGAAAILGAVGGAVGAVFPVGTIIVAVVAVVAAIAVGIATFFNWFNQQQKQKKAFDIVNGSGEEALMRLENLINDVETVVNKVQSNITIYSITGNYEQQVILNIAGQYYIINFTKSMKGSKYEWSASVEDMDGNALDTVMHTWSPVTSMLDMNRDQNMWFRDKTKQYEVYLMNPSLSGEVNATKEEMENVKANLEGYSIWVSKGNIKTNVDKILDAINDAITAEGFV